MESGESVVENSRFFSSKERISTFPPEHYHKEKLDIHIFLSLKKNCLQLGRQTGVLTYEITYNGEMRERKGFPNVVNMSLSTMRLTQS